ncbi:Pentatricopeptide repeat-containing protein [Drosera capensis]
MDDPDGAFKTWQEMEIRGCFPDTNTYCVMIEGLFKCNTTDDAWYLLGDLSELGDLSMIQKLSEHMRKFYNPAMARRFSLSQKRKSSSLRGKENVVETVKSFTENPKWSFLFTMTLSAPEREGKGRGNEARVNDAASEVITETRQLLVENFKQESMRTFFSNLGLTAPDLQKEDLRRSVPFSLKSEDEAMVDAYQEEKLDQYKSIDVSKRCATAELQEQSVSESSHHAEQNSTQFPWQAMELLTGTSPCSTTNMSSGVVAALADNSKRHKDLRVACIESFLSL